MQEIWKDIPNYEGIYQISNLGNVKSLERGIMHAGHFSHIKEKIMKPFKNKGGYYCIKLSKNQKYKPFKIHRLVAICFIPNPNGYECVNHKDEDKTNNNVSNLEWCTKSYNNNYGTRQLRKRKVLQYNLEGDFVAQYESITMASKHTGIPYSGIKGCCHGESNTSYGYIWCFDSSEIKEKLNKFINSKPIKVSVYSKDGQYIETIENIAIACKKYNVTKSLIHRCCKGFEKTCKGYVWKYESE